LTICGQLLALSFMEPPEIMTSSDFCRFYVPRPGNFLNNGAEKEERPLHLGPQSLTLI
jgi:hypothetical protein